MAKAAKAMDEDVAPVVGSDVGPDVSYESTPLTRSEYIAAIVHLYRGELYRANSWRIRLDNTTNWAVLTTAGLLTFSFGEGLHSHWILLIGMALITVFLGFESRRLRFADVWRARVRMIEENFYGPILRRDPVSRQKSWGTLVAKDLFRPRFKMTKLQALRARLVRNYWPIYAVLLFAWSVKVFGHVDASGAMETWSDVEERLVMGFVPWWVPFAYIASFLLFGSLLVALVKKHTDESSAWSSADDAAASDFLSDL